MTENSKIFTIVSKATDSLRARQTGKEKNIFLVNHATSIERPPNFNEGDKSRICKEEGKKGIVAWQQVEVIG